MSDWQERITRETPPAIRIEHELRYRIAAPLLGQAAAWVDLGCGNGVAAAAALGGVKPAHVVLVDLDATAVDRAARELELPHALGMTSDLTDPAELDLIRDSLLKLEGQRVVTCFEVVEHLSSFIPLLEWSAALASAGEATFVTSVPNDAFWSIQNPHHLSAWGEGAFEELRRLLPAEQTLLRQTALTGSAVLDWDSSIVGHQLSANVGGPDAVTTHFIAAYGPLHGEVWRGALAAQADMQGQRSWERQRENDLAVMQRSAEEHGQTVAELHGQLQQRIAWFDEWRKYIHELERELGRPLSGASEDELPAQDGAAAVPADEDASAFGNRT